MITLASQRYTIAAYGGTLDSRYPEGNNGYAWGLLNGHFESAKITLEIIAPREGLTGNRYYKAYPGIEYRVPVVVLGGAWPFHYELTSAPSGMTIGADHADSDYGVIVWSNPTGGPHTVTAKVTDQSGTQATVTWTLTVTTSGFLFVDAAAVDDSGTGAIASPFKTVNGWYKSNKFDTTYDGYFVYYRAGTYQTSAGALEDGYKLTMGGKPVAHMAYPGESATISVSGGHMYWNGGTGNNIFVGGLTISGVGAGSRDKAIAWDSGRSDIVIFGNTFADPADSGGYTNPSHIMSQAGSGTTSYVGIVGNTYEGCRNHNLFLGYSCNKGVIENNTLTADANSASAVYGFYLKSGFQYWSIRKNAGLSNPTYAHLCRVDTYGTAADVEVCWNNWRTQSRGMILEDVASPVSNIYDYRNTWQVLNNRAKDISGGDWFATRNVVVHDGTYTQGYGVSAGGVTITRTELLAATSGLVTAATGVLVGADRTTYLGIRGHEVS